MFGFIGDIFEGVADAILPPKGTRGSTFGSIVGGSIGGPTGAAIGGKVGGSVSSQLSKSTASGSAGQGAVSTPTVSQSPRAAAESPQSGAKSGSTMQVAYSRNSGLTNTSLTGLPAPRSPAGEIATTVGGAILENVMDWDLGEFFGGSSGAVCGTSIKPLISVRRDAQGRACLSVTRKQQHQLKKMVEYVGLQETARLLDLSTTDTAALLVKRFPPRRKGITAAQLRNAKRVNRQVLGMAKQLTDACKPTTRRR